VSTRCDPMKPAPPITRHVVMKVRSPSTGAMDGHRGRALRPRGLQRITQGETPSPLSAAFPSRGGTGNLEQKAVCEEVAPKANGEPWGRDREEKKTKLPHLPVRTHVRNGESSPGCLGAILHCRSEMGLQAGCAVNGCQHALALCRGSLARAPGDLVCLL
jgi:hypothetical protein